MLAGSAALILAHNHPSGDPDPSAEDIALTRRLAAAGQVLERQRERTNALEQAQGRIIPWIFHRNGKRIRDFRGAWATACKAAGLSGRLIYDMKRSAARNFVRAGVSVVASMKMAGWKIDAIFRRHAIVDETMLKEAATKLGALQSEQARRRARKSQVRDQYKTAV
jgi:hypothetical protein